MSRLALGGRSGGTKLSFLKKFSLQLTTSVKYCIRVNLLSSFHLTLSWNRFPAGVLHAQLFQERGSGHRPVYEAHIRQNILVVHLTWLLDYQFLRLGKAGYRAIMLNVCIN